MDRQDKINFWLAVIAICISLVGVFYPIYNDNRIRTIVFENDGIQNRPLLELVEPIGHIRYDVKPKNPMEWREGTPLNIEMILTVEPELRVANEGGSVACLLFKVVTDEYSGLPTIREMLFDEGSWGASFTVQLTEDFYKVHNIPPAGNYTLKIPHTVNDFNFDAGEFTLHYLVARQSKVYPMPHPENVHYFQG